MFGETLHFLRLLGVLAAVSLVVSAQEPAGPTIRVVSPEADSYISGLTLLKAVVEPPGRSDDFAKLLFIRKENGVAAQFEQG